MNTGPLLSFWLLPARKERELLQTVICRLAQQYDAVEFCPHLTLFTLSAAQVLASHSEGDRFSPGDRPLTEMDWDTALASGMTNLQPLSLKIQDICSGSEFAKTVFIRLNTTPLLSDTIAHLRQMISPSATLDPPPTLDPHISLIYQTLAIETKEAIARSIALDQQVLHFDEIQIVQAPAKFEDSTDVKQLSCLYSKVLARNSIA